jgi:23S rRNA (cytidine1920-2'-O)/16S rRNA (cytidine1409-2'-O)-methyltransferase
MVERGLAESRGRAQALIEAGLVRSGGEILLRASRLFGPEAPLEVAEPVNNWVSRAALKLIAALDAFEIDPAGRVALDIGASTGGFTEVLLARGCVRVHAIDVGHGQIALKLRDDPRVIVREGLNARYLTPADIGEQAGIVTCDASFIGLEILLPAPLALAAPDAYLVALIKPQFEVGRDRIGGGVVRDPALRQEVRQRIENWLADQPGWRILGIIDSPIEGGDGNREFLIAARKDAGSSSMPA